MHRYSSGQNTHFGYCVSAAVRCQISRPVDSGRGPSAGFAIEVGPTPRRQRSRSGDWPASTELWRIPRREARRADFPGMKGRSTMVVNLIMRPRRPRSFADQTGPPRSEQPSRPTYLARDSSASSGGPSAPIYPLCMSLAVWVPETLSSYATWAYSRIRPPSRSRRRTRIFAPIAGGCERPAGGFCCSVRCGR